MPLLGGPNVEKLKAKRDAKGLINALGYERDPQVRQAAADALNELGWQPGADEAGATYYATRRDWDACAAVGGSAVQPLIRIMRDSKEIIEIRTQAALTLAKIGAPAIQPLIAALADKKEDAAKLAQMALVNIGEPAVRPLIAALSVNNEYVQAQAFEALAAVAPRIGEPVVPVLIEEHKRQHARVDSGGSSVPRHESLAAGYIDMVLGALGVLAIPPLIDMVRGLKSPHSDPGLSAIAPLVAMGAAAVEPLIELLADGNYLTRMVAVTALQKICDPRAVEPLKKVWGQDTEWDVRSSAADALATLGGISQQELALWRSRGLSAVEPLMQRVAAALSRGGNLRSGKPAAESAKQEIREVGQRLYEMGGFTLMRLVCYQYVASMRAGKETAVSNLWVGIGPWRDDPNYFGV